MINDTKEIKSLSLKITFFASIFLLLFMVGIAFFSFFYFLISEINDINGEVGSSIELIPNSINETIYLDFSDNENYIDEDKLNLAIEVKDELKGYENFTVTTKGNETFKADIIDNATNLLGLKSLAINNINVNNDKHLFELARDSLIIGRDGKYTSNGIFNFESFNIEDLILRSPGIFTELIGNKLYLFKKFSTSDFEIIFAKDITYIKDFSLKMFFVGLISSLIFFLIVYFLSTYLLKLFLRPINEYNKKLKEYNHNLAHEIKTPLTVVNLNLELLENDENRDIVESNKEEIEKIKNITDSLLFLSENFTLREIQKIEINECVNSYYSKSIFKNNIKIINSKKEIELLANKNMFERLLKNLGENAMKYSTDKKLEITITDNYISFKNNVEKCLTRKELEMIFEAFYQIDSSRNNSGYGLGLMLVKRIVDIFKWDLEANCDNTVFEIRVKY